MRGNICRLLVGGGCQIWYLKNSVLYPHAKTDVDQDCREPTCAAALSLAKWNWNSYDYVEQLDDNLISQ